jgi:acyl dehydratase|uniref:MaoC/PaaZ C-terminal domain-containing protein n=1 Tax=Candidatus Planktophila sp. TaxID=2175601 RepID=UPI004049CD2A
MMQERIFKIDRELLKRYADASGDQNPIHQDETFARSVGLPDVIAHGMLTMGLVGQYVSDWAGGSTNVKEYSARFIKPVVVPANTVVELVVNGVATEESGLYRLELTATVDGVKVLGMAKALVKK